MPCHRGPAGRHEGRTWDRLSGVNIGNFIWYALTAFGLIALIQQSPIAYTALRWIGVFYLAWLGIQMLRGKDSRLANQSAKCGQFQARIFQWACCAYVQPQGPDVLCCLHPALHRSEW